MAADALAVELASSHRSPPIVRFFSWAPPAVSLGFHQPAEAVNAAACRRLGWELVRRPTGGRALLHKGDLCYSVALHTTNGNLNLLSRLYRQTGLAIAETIQELGIAVQPSGEDGASLRSVNRSRNGLCLEARVRGEIATGRGKFAAAAQRLFPGGILQQGSILVTAQPGEIAQVISGDQPAIAAKLRRRACSLEEAAGWQIDVNDLIIKLAARLSDRLELELLPSEWSEEELTQIASRREDWLIPAPAGEMVQHG